MFADFNIINTFLTIAKIKSFSKASQTLQISQPAVTLQMKKLEEIVGVTLLLRKKNGILLTKEGEKFKELCERLQRNIHVFNEDMANIKDARAKVIIATTPTLQESFLPVVLDDIVKIFDKGVDIRVKDDSELSKYVEDSRCDIAFGSKSSFSKTVISKEFFKYKLLLVSNKKRSSSISPSALSSLKFIKDRSKPLDTIFHNFPARFEDLDAAYVVDGTMAVCSILYHSSEEYYAFLPEFLVKKGINDGIIHKVDIKGVTLEQTIYAASPRENEKMLDKILLLKR